MLQITGQVVNVFTLDAGKDKDGKDAKYDVMDLTVDDLTDWVGLKGKVVSIDVGAFAPSKGNIVCFVRKGAKPRQAMSSVA
jgi:hypothetical protein